MVQKTRKRKHNSQGVMTIPELRRSFEHIESYLDDKLNRKEPKDKLITEFRKEWEKVFNKELDKKSAEAFIEHSMTSKKSLRHKTSKRRIGGADPLQGAPLDYTTRPGIYIQPAAIPPNAYGNILEYVSKGFWNPEQAHQYDPVPGQTVYPTSVPVGMGDNTFHKGGRRKTRVSKLKSNNTRKLRRGGSRLIPAESPSSYLQDVQDSWYGRPTGPSSDQVFRQPM